MHADNAGGAQLPREAIEAAARFLEAENSQRGGPFARKLRVDALVADARRAFGELIGVAAETVGFCANTTSAAFDVARCLASAIRPGDRVVVTDADHYANVAPWTWLQRFGAEVDRIPVDRSGELDESAFAAALAREPALIALPWASNGTGSVFDLARFSGAAKDAGALVVADGVQAAPHLRVTIPESVDVAFFSAYKIFAPHVGAFFARPEFARRFFTCDDPSIPSPEFNWSMETGTQNHEGLAGWLGTYAYLLECGNGDARDAMARFEVYERELTAYALAAFADRADRVTLYGRHAVDNRLPVFSFNVRGEAPLAVAAALAAAGIEAAVGDNYAPRLLKTLTPETGGVAVRFSFAHYNDAEDVDRCMAALDATIGATA